MLSIKAFSGNAKQRRIARRALLRRMESYRRWQTMMDELCTGMFDMFFAPDFAPNPLFERLMSAEPSTEVEYARR